MNDTGNAGSSRSRALLAASFIGAGLNHFIMRRTYRAVVPPGFGDPAIAVAVSGVAEIVGGAGVLIQPTRRLAGWWLIGLLIAVFPANIYMAIKPEAIPGPRVPRVLLWLRLPLQPLMIYGVWKATQNDA